MAPDVFDCPRVIQLTDDEKFLFKANLKIEQVKDFAFKNARDIIACGFKLEKTSSSPISTLSAVRSTPTLCASRA